MNSPFFPPTGQVRNRSQVEIPAVVEMNNFNIQETTRSMTDKIVEISFR